jgi:hypothetical protein
MPPDFMGWLHWGHAGASSVMRRTLTERPLRPEATWTQKLPCACAAVICADSPQRFDRAHRQLPRVIPATFAADGAKAADLQLQHSTGACAL